MIYLRLSNFGDESDLLAWRNDNITRRMSREKNIVEKEQHSKWFHKTLNDPNKILLIGMRDKQKIGMVRFDKCENNLWETSIVVAPEFREKGLGKILLQSAVEYFYRKHSKAILIAEVLKTNEPSRKIFNSVGYKESSFKGEYVRYIYESRIQ